MSEEREFIFLWEIENLNFCSQTNENSIVSPDFKSLNLYETSWRLMLYPRGDYHSEDGYMACYLYRNNDNGPTEIDCEYEIQVLGSEETILESKIGSHTFTKEQFGGFIDFWNESLPLNNIYAFLNLRCRIKSNVEKIPLRLASMGKTKIEVDKYSFIWIVRKLNSNCSEVKKFPCIEITIQVPEDDVKIICKFGGIKPVSVSFKISLLDVYDRKCDSKEALNFCNLTMTDEWEIPHFLKKSKLNAEKERFLENDCFTLKCKIEISNDKETESVEDNKVFRSCTGTKEVLEDYRKLYKERIHTDVKILVEGEIIQAHKSILSARSPVFLAMFGADMIENETGSVTIPDFEAKTVNLLMDYIYTGTLIKLNCKMATKLIVAADKYQVLSLKEECADLLKCFLSHENVCDVLLVADLIQHEVLKAAVMIYIKTNSDTIFLSEEWKSVVKNNIPLAAETLQKVSVLIAADRKTTENE